MNPTIYTWGHYQLAFADEGIPKSAKGAREVSGFSGWIDRVPVPWLWMIDPRVQIDIDPQSQNRLSQVARDTGAGLIYADFYQKEKNALSAHPLIDCQEGSIRDDFNFGHLWMLSVAAMQSVLQKYGALPQDPEAAWYDLRLKLSTDHALVRVPECLYTVTARTARKTRTLFDYVEKANADRQQRFEGIATAHLERIGAHLPPRTRLTDPPEEAFPVVASVVIPVLNRKKTIADALDSALGQKTDFSFNIIVVDNHSTDGTTQIIRELSAKHTAIIHHIPARNDLGIGGCWNEAIHSPRCGRFAVQLDSDDLYSSPDTLQTIVNLLIREHLAMVVGSYTLVDEQLKVIEPGLIDHSEWTAKNGHNNLLRVNGMGAPRAFDTEVLRERGFPNVSYGEDYAVALGITREYRIGRIYENLYWCRRWSDNTDASLPVEKQNRHEFYKDTLRTLEIRARRKISHSVNRAVARFPQGKTPSLVLLCRDLLSSQTRDWPDLALGLANLAGVQTRTVDCGPYRVDVQFNPGRRVSSGAAVDPASIRKRPCFLCPGNLPPAQKGILYHNAFWVLCNPAPIFHGHYTVSSLGHHRQAIRSGLASLLMLARDASPDLCVFYNGPAAGASAPDHLHFQLVTRKSLPLLNDLANHTGSAVDFLAAFDRSVVTMASRDEDRLVDRFHQLLQTVAYVSGTPEEPMLNVVGTWHEGLFELAVFLRRKHRPAAYFAKDDGRLFVSPGAIDMAGVVITPEERDFERLDGPTLRDLYREVSLDAETLRQILKEWE